MLFVELKDSESIFLDHLFSGDDLNFWPVFNFEVDVVTAVSKKTQDLIFALLILQILMILLLIDLYLLVWLILLVRSSCVLVVFVEPVTSSHDI
jgi:hypothetical protein